jgi:hypothetical protein
MAERTPLPDRARLQKFLNRLLVPDEEMDDETAAAILEAQGITDQMLADDLRAAFEAEIKSLESQGLDVPESLRQALASLPAGQQEKAEDDPDTWVRKMFEGGASPDAMAPSQSSPLHAFRDLDVESLSEEDRQILERLAEELQAGAGEGEG